MNRLIEPHNPEKSPVAIVELECLYQAGKQATTFSAAKQEGIYASVQFIVKNPPGKVQVTAYGVVAVEFTFVLLDTFDNFLASIQGIAGPGKYIPSRKKHRANWVFELEGAFSQYHALCFPSQARLIDGDVWKCNKKECVDWANASIYEGGVRLTIDDVFPDGYAMGSATYEG